MKKLLCGLMLVGVLGFGSAGCVSQATQEKIVVLSEKIADLEDNLTAISKQSKDLYDLYKAGGIGQPEFVAKSTEMLAELAKTNAELALAKKDLAETQEVARKEGDNPWAVVGLTLLNVAAIIVGRKIGVPGLASGTTSIVSAIASKRRKKK